MNLSLAAEANDMKNDTAAGLANNLMTVIIANKGRILDLFREWDTDGDGRIDKAEFKRALEELEVLKDGKEGIEQFKAIWGKFDPDGSGVIDLEELKKIMQTARASASRTQSSLKTATTLAPDGVGEGRQGKAAGRGALSDGAEEGEEGAEGGDMDMRAAHAAYLARRRRVLASEPYTETLRRRQEEYERRVAELEEHKRVQDEERRRARVAAAQASASKALQRAAERPSHFLSPDAKGALFEAVAQTRLLPMQRAWHAGQPELYEDEQTQRLMRAGLRSARHGQHAATPPFPYASLPPTDPVTAVTARAPPPHWRPTASRDPAAPRPFSAAASAYAARGLLTPPTPLSPRASPPLRSPRHSPPASPLRRGAPDAAPPRREGAWVREF